MREATRGWVLLKGWKMEVTVLVEWAAAMESRAATTPIVNTIISYLSLQHY